MSVVFGFHCDLVALDLALLDRGLLVLVRAHGARDLRTALLEIQHSGGFICFAIPGW